MAFVIAELHAPPSPLQGESALILSLSENPEQGYRLKAHTPGNSQTRQPPRIIGRWVSECPLSVCQAALLWISQYPWQIQEDEQGLSINMVLDQVPSITQILPIHPLDTLELLLSNWPKREPTASTGAVARFRRPGQPAVVVLPGGAAADEPNPPPQLTHEANDLHRFLSRAMGALERGADPQIVLARTSERYQMGVASEPASLPPEPAQPVIQIPGPPEAEVDDEEVEALLAQVNADLDDVGEDDATLIAEGVRIQSEKDRRQFLEFSADSDRLGAKLRRTQERGLARTAHVQEHLARHGQSPLVKVSDNGTPKALTPEQAAALHAENVKAGLQRLQRQKSALVGHEESLLAEAASLGIEIDGAPVVSPEPATVSVPTEPGPDSPTKDDFIGVIVTRHPDYEDTEEVRKELRRKNKWAALRAIALPFMGQGPVDSA